MGPPTFRHQASLVNSFPAFESPCLSPQETSNASRIYDEIMAKLRPNQQQDSGFEYEPITLLHYMKAFVSSTNEYLMFFFRFIQLNMLGSHDEHIHNVLSILDDVQVLSSEYQLSLSHCVFSFAQVLVMKFFAPLKSQGGKTPQVTPQGTSDITRRQSLQYSPTNRNLLACLEDNPRILGTPDRLRSLRNVCLARDKHRCVVTGAFDFATMVERRRQLRISATSNTSVKDDDDQPIDFATVTEAAHIIPHSLMSQNAQGEVGEEKQAAWRILRMFGSEAIDLISDCAIDDPTNALILHHTFHVLFGQFRIYFQQESPFLSHTYLINVHESEDALGCPCPLPVTRTLTHPQASCDPPSPKLLAIHCAIGRILHLSGAGLYIDAVLRDMEEMTVECASEHGTTCLGDLVAWKLGSHPFLPNPSSGVY